MSLFQELKRRNVIRVGLAYIVTAWLLLQIADVILNNIEAPGWVFQAILLVMGLGFPLAVVFAWAYEMTPDGIKKEKEVDRSESITRITGRKLDLAIIIALVAALVYFAVDKFGVSSEEDLLQSADTELASTAMGAAAAPDKSIAVLPFVNMSSDPEQEYFSDGIAEELLNVLAQFPKLRVAARTSSFQFKGENQDIGKIAETLKVAHVLEGSVRKSGTRLRITAQLIKADDGYHLWSETYDREMDDIFAIQDEIAAAISAALQAELALGGGSDTAPPVIIQAANTQAYEAFLQGRRLIHRRGRESLEDAVRYLERSLRLDANYAPAHANLAIATIMLMESPETYGNLSLAEVNRRAIPHIERALELAPDMAEAYAAKGLLSLHQGDPQNTVTHTRKALEINPSYTDAMNWQRNAVNWMGRYGEGRDLMAQILEADPLTIVGRLNYVGYLQGQQELDEALAVADSLLQQSPWASYSARAQLAIYSDAEIAKGLFWILQAYSADPGDMLSNSWLVDVLISIGEYDEARRVSDALVPDVYLAEGRIDDAVRTISEKRMADPDNRALVLREARINHFAGRSNEALTLYEKLATAELRGRPIDGDNYAMTRLAFSRNRTGNIDGAKEAFNVVASDVQALLENGYRGPYLRFLQAMLASYQGDADSTIKYLSQAVDLGFRTPILFTDPVFDAMKDDERFIRIESGVLQALVLEREKAIQLMCFQNPVPGAWQPLPETCEGVVEQPLEL